MDGILRESVSDGLGQQYHAVTDCSSDRSFVCPYFLDSKNNDLNLLMITILEIDSTLI